MWKPEFLKAKKTAAQTRDDQKDQKGVQAELAAKNAERGSKEIVAMADDHLKSLLNTIGDHQSLGLTIGITEEKLKELGAKIDDADKLLGETKKEVAARFDSLSATFTALCEKVKQGNLPSTALASGTEGAEALQKIVARSKSEAAVVPKTPGA